MIGTERICWIPGFRAFPNQTVRLGIFTDLGRLRAPPNLWETFSRFAGASDSTTSTVVPVLRAPEDTPESIVRCHIGDGRRVQNSHPSHAWAGPPHFRTQVLNCEYYWSQRRE